MANSQPISELSSKVTLDDSNSTLFIISIKEGNVYKSYNVEFSAIYDLIKNKLSAELRDTYQNKEVITSLDDARAKAHDTQDYYLGPGVAQDLVSELDKKPIVWQ